METGITIGIFCVLILLAAYIIERLERALHEEQAKRRTAEFEAEGWKSQLADMKERTNFYSNEASKAEKKYKRLKEDYDMLLSSHRELSNDNL